MNSWLKMALVLVVLLGTRAVAEPDSFGLGSGRDGLLRVGAAGTRINTYALVIWPLAPGDTEVKVPSAAGFGAGDLVMVFQTTGLVPVPSAGNPWPVALGNEPVGRWELARLASVGDGKLRLTAPLSFSYAAAATQVIRVPEYTSVTVERGASLSPSPWDGSTGGVLAFLATGDILNDGEISASGAGFRGGLYVRDLTRAAGCLGLEEPAALGAQKGEGIAVTRFGASHTGAGNVSNGGGGGVCQRSGGGGGGNGGPGGQGGRTLGSDGAREVGGLGGALLSFSLLDHLSFGGGGGAGHGNNEAFLPVPDGGRGGGVVLIRGGSLLGRGAVLARGEVGGGALEDGAGGGGAGGSISLRLAGTASCGRISASGGMGGGTTLARVGPGGGGGGGRVLFQAASGRGCSASAIDAGGGLAGSQPDAFAEDGPGFGAQPAPANAGFYNGAVTTLSGGFSVPPVPKVVSPSGGTLAAGKPVTGTAAPGSTVIIYVDGVEVGRTMADAGGHFSFTLPRELNAGTQEVRVAAESQGVLSARSAALSIRPLVVCTSAPVLSIISVAPIYTDSANKKWTGSATVSAYLSTCYSSNNSVVYSYRVNGNGSAPYISCPTAGNPDGNPCTIPLITTGSQALTIKVCDSTDPATCDTANFPAFTYDKTPPGLPTLTSYPAAVTSSTTAGFGFTSTESNLDRFECKLESDADYAPCGNVTPGTFSRSNLSEGPHLFQVRAVDSAQNAGLPAAYAWTVDTSPPAAVIDTKPSDPSKQSMPTFTFHGVDTRSSIQKFQCRYYVSSLVPLPAFADCGAAAVADAGSFTITNSPLLDGTTYKFELRAVDMAGNVDGTPASYQWTVDLAEPQTTLLPVLPAWRNLTTETFAFSASETATFDCKLDAGSFQHCASPVSLNVTEGHHTFSVRATDMVGNVESTPAVVSWDVEMQAPTPTIVSMPGLRSSAASVTFTFSATDSASGVNAATYECRHYTSSPLPAPGSLPTFSNCSTGTSYTASGLTSGFYTFEVQVKDNAGNVGFTSYSWEEDRTPPTVAISAGPASVTSATSTTAFVFNSPSDAIATYRCVLDGAATSIYPCAQTLQPVPIVGVLGDGTHTLDVYARDSLGNETPVAAAAHWSWVVDTLRPTISWVGDQAARTPPKSTSTSAQFQFASEPGSTFLCTLDDPADAVHASPYPCASPANFVNVTSGDRIFTVTARDPAGNLSNPLSLAWTIDTKIPTTLINGQKLPNSVTTNVVQMSLHLTIQTFVPNVSYLCRYSTPDSLSAGAVFVPCSTSAPDASGALTVAYDALDGDGQYRVQVVAVNNATQNQDPNPAIFAWTLDTTPPSIQWNETPSGKSNDLHPEFKFTPTEVGVTFSCQIDGVVLAATDCKKTGTMLTLPDVVRSHTFTVTVTDPAGNVGIVPYPWEVNRRNLNAPVITSPANGAFTNVFHPQIAGTAIAGGTISLTHDGGENWSTTIDVNGNWAFTIPDGMENAKLYTISASATDVFGNVSPAANALFTYDKDAPEVTLGAHPDALSRDRAPTVAFTATDIEPAGNISFEFRSGDTGIFHSCDNGFIKFEDIDSSVSCADGTLGLQSLPDGVYDLRARAKDAAGNVSEPVLVHWELYTGKDSVAQGGGAGCSTTAVGPSFSLLGLALLAWSTRRRLRS